MKIITWNINGLRAALEKGAWDWIKQQNAEVICLQEIKARPDQLTAEQHAIFDGYQAFWNPAQKPGYSGVLTLAQIPPVDVTYGLGVSEFDGEGRVICIRYPDFLLYNIYFPNGQRDLGRLTYKLDFYAHLLDICQQQRAAGEQIILCGDFNTAHREIDLRNPKENAQTSGFLPEERAWIDRYLEAGFIDIYRLRNPDRVQYTWWTYRLSARKRNVGWRLDYYLVSTTLVDLVEQVEINDTVMGSDHCPVTLIVYSRIPNREHDG